jgi:hypothetical protein
VPPRPVFHLDASTSASGYFTQASR